jgi:hypothetical protein
VGELEAETAHRSNLLDKAHHKIGELERRYVWKRVYLFYGNIGFIFVRFEGNLGSDDFGQTLTEEMERKIAQLDKAYNDSQWRFLGGLIFVKGKVEYLGLAN